MLQRNLVYSGIAQGTQLVVPVGQQKALAMAVRNNWMKNHQLMRVSQEFRLALTDIHGRCALAFLQVSPATKVQTHSSRGEELHPIIAGFVMRTGGWLNERLLTR